MGNKKDGWVCEISTENSHDLVKHSMKEGVEFRYFLSDIKAFA